MDPHHAPHRALTPTEEALIEYVARGMVDAEIAVRLGLSTADVKSRITRLLQDFRLLDRAALATWDPTEPPPPLQPNDQPRRPRRFAIVAICAIAGAVGAISLLLSDASGEDDGKRTAADGSSAEDLARYLPYVTPSTASHETAILTDPRPLAVPETFGFDEVQYKGEVRYDGSFAVIIQATGVDGTPIGIDRVDATGSTPLFRPPDGGEFHSAEAGADPARLAATYGYDGHNWLTWSFDGGTTWSEPFRIRSREVLTGVVSTGVFLSTEPPREPEFVGSGSMLTFERDRVDVGSAGEIAGTIVGELSPGVFVWPNFDGGLMDEAGDVLFSVSIPGPRDPRVTGFLQPGAGEASPRVVTSRSVTPRNSYITLVGDDGAAKQTWIGDVGTPLAAAGRYVITRSCYVWELPVECYLGRFDVLTGAFGWYVDMPYEGTPIVLGVAPLPR